ncbi:MAG: Holliday junction branch migration protein RuvA [Nitriliruptoraceae bacterium]
MIGHLHGVVAHRDTSHVVVDVHGVGYVVQVAAIDRVPARGASVELFTSLQVREDSMTLYGFADRPSLETFELLLHASGVGPRLAMAALATLPASDLRSAIAAGDVATLTTIAGVGKKVAERMVLELQDRLGALTGSVSPASTAASPGDDEVRDALLALGYTVGEIAEVLPGIADGDDSTEARLRQALQALGSRAKQGA